MGHMKELFISMQEGLLQGANAERERADRAEANTIAIYEVKKDKKQEDER